MWILTNRDSSEQPPEKVLNSPNEKSDPKRDATAQF